MNLHITTPFGRRPLTAAQINAQARAAACPRDATVNKWTVFRHIALAKDWIGVTDRSLAVLNALLTFHPDTTLTPGGGVELVVFPSNEQLALRAHGMAEPTLRRHLGALVEAGLVIRRDSPNGKRYARKGAGGVVAQAFGFDLTPIVARASEFEQQADLVTAERRKLAVAREAVTILRRDAAKLLAAGEDVASGPWAAYAARYEALMAGLGRTPGLDKLEATRTALVELVASLSMLFIVHDKTSNPSGNAGHSDRHNQNSKPETPDLKKVVENGDEAVPDRPIRMAPSRVPDYPLPMVLDACPDIALYARGGIKTWGDLVGVSDLVRGMLGISPDAWREARDVMGPEVAAATIAAILQRAEHIKSPGGYLRTLVARKRLGQYSLAPVMLALVRARIVPAPA